MFTFFWHILATVIFFIAISTHVDAAPASFMYQGRIVASDGQPLEYHAVSFNFTVLSPDGGCVLFREQMNNIDMRNSRGVFETALGLGVKTYPVNPIFSMVDAFNNSLPLTCDGGVTYSPQLNDGRVLRVQFFDGNGWKLITPDSLIRSVPYSSFAGSAQKLGNRAASEFVLRTSVPSCDPGEVITFDGAGFSCVTGSSSGAVTSVSSAAPLSVGGTATTPVLSLPRASSTVDGYLAASDFAALTAKQGTALANASIWIGNASNSATPQIPGGDVSMTNGGSFTVQGLRGHEVDNVTLGASDTGKIYRWDGDSLAPHFLNINDLRKADGSGQFASASCSAGKTLTWSSLADTFTCTDILITVAQISDLPNFEASGTTGQIQFNDADSFGASSSLVWDSTASQLQVTGQVKIAGGSPGLGKVLTSDASGVASWESLPAPSGGTLTGLSAAAPISVGGTSTVPSVSIARATASVDGYLESGDFEKFETTIRGNFVAVGTLSGTDTGKIYKWGGTSFAASFLNISDLRKADGSSQFASASCAAGQTLNWSVLTDTFSCVTIAITSSQVSDFPTLGSAAAKNFGSLAGNLVELDSTGKIPSSLLPTISGGGDFLADGTVTMTGNIRLGANAISNDGGAGEGLTFDSAGRGAVSTLSGGVAQALTLINTGATAASGIGLSFKHATVIGASIESIVGTSSQNTSLVFSNRQANTLVEVMRITSGGNIGMGTATPSLGAILDLTSTASTSSLLLPRDTTSNRPTTLSAGMIRFNTTTNAVEFYNGSAWASLSTISSTGPTFASAVNISAGGSTSYLATDPSNPSPINFGPSVNMNASSNLDGLGSQVIFKGNNAAGVNQRAIIASVSTSGAASYTPSLVFGSQSGASSYRERMRIDPNGRLGVGTTSPDYAVDVSGDISATGCVRAGGATLGGVCASDERLKTDVQRFDLGLQELLGISPKLFRYNGLAEIPISENLELGVIAQEIEKAAPSLIIKKSVMLHQDDATQTEIKQVNYTAFTYVLINAVKEIYGLLVSHSQEADRRLASIEVENVRLRLENEELRKRMEKLEERILD